MQLTRIDLSLLTLFLIVTFFEPTLFACFLRFKQNSACFYIDGNTYLTIFFKNLDFIELFFLNSNASTNNLFERLSMRDFLFSFSVNSLYDFLMHLYTPFLALSILKFC